MVAGTLRVPLSQPQKRHLPRTFYDKGAASDGWRYLEAVPASTVFEPTNYTRWQSDHVAELIGSTDTAIGSGKRNTEIILAKFIEWGEPDTFQNNRKTAAKLCDDFVYGGKTDWFLPSKDELYAMYLSLGDSGMENALIDFGWEDEKQEDNWFSREDWGGWENKHCWSSSENSDAQAWVQALTTGSQWSSNKEYEYMVRAVRAF